MKVAIVCDDLVQHGGAEKIIEAISEIFPDAPIYTSIATKNWKSHFSSKNRKVITSFMQKFPFASKLNRFYSVFYLHVLAIESFDFSQYDLVFSLSSRYAHFAITKPGTKHICYLNTPGRMFWEPFDYFEKDNLGLSRPLSFLKKIGIFLIKPYLSWMRVADYVAMRRPDLIICNAILTQKRLKKYFGLSAEIVHPFTDLKFEENSNGKDDFYLILTRLVSWKRVDLAIRACEKLGRKLIVAGDGPDKSRLRALSGENTVFLGHVNEDKKRELLCTCRALINTQKEDFGIVPLEAMVAGKPVIAYGAGGALETVIDDETGIFFYEQNVISLCSAIEEFERKKFDSDRCKKRAGEFSSDNFKYSILERVNSTICI